MSRISTSSAGGNVNIQDTNGNPITATAGSLNVNVVDTAFGTQNVRVLYNETAAVAVGIETTINTYTAPSGVTSYLLSILSSGENRGTFNVYNNASLLDRQYTNVTQLTSNFDYQTGSSTVPGLIIAVGNVLTVTTVNAGTDTALYNARFLILEVTPA